MTALTRTIPSWRSRAPLLALAAVFLLTSGGCLFWNPPSWDFTYNTPPTAVDGRDPNLGRSGKRVVVIGDFRNPDNPLGWQDVGSGVARTLSQSLLNEGDFDVWYNAPLAQEVQTILDGPTTERERLLGEVGGRHQEVRYVLVVAPVTDFHHTGEVPREARRRLFLFWTHKEAIAAIDFAVVDLKARRIVVADHVYGLNESGGRSQAKVYQNIRYNSYLFWNSPLGRATEKAVAKAEKRISETLPTAEEGIQVSRYLEYRKIEVTGDGLRGLGVGDNLYLASFDGDHGQILPVKDPHTAEPLRATIIGIRGDTATVWLRGEPPRSFQLADAEFLTSLPGEPLDPPAVATAPN